MKYYKILYILILFILVLITNSFAYEFISPNTLGNGRRNYVYVYYINVDEGSPSFTLTGGSLPAGLNLTTIATTPSMAKISGTPTTEATYSFTITADWGAGITKNKTFSIQIYNTTNKYISTQSPLHCKIPTAKSIINFMGIKYHDPGGETHYTGIGTTVASGLIAGEYNDDGLLLYGTANNLTEGDYVIKYFCQYNLLGGTINKDIAYTVQPPLEVGQSEIISQPINLSEDSLIQFRFLYTNPATAHSIVINSSAPQNSDLIFLVNGSEVTGVSYTITENLTLIGSRTMGAGETRFAYMKLKMNPGGPINYGTIFGIRCKARRPLLAEGYQTLIDYVPDESNSGSQLIFKRKAVGEIVSITKPDGIPNITPNIPFDIQIEVKNSCLADNGTDLYIDPLPTDLRFEKKSDASDLTSEYTVSAATATTISPQNTKAFIYTVTLKPGGTSTNVLIKVKNGQPFCKDNNSRSIKDKDDNYLYLDTSPAPFAGSVEIGSALPPNFELVSITNAPILTYSGQQNIVIKAQVQNNVTGSICNPAKEIITTLELIGSSGNQTGYYTINPASTNPYNLAQSDGAKEFKWIVSISPGAPVNQAIKIYPKFICKDFYTNKSVNKTISDPYEEWIVCSSTKVIEIENITTDKTEVFSGQKNIEIKMNVKNNAPYEFKISSATYSGLNFIYGISDDTSNYTISTPTPASPYNIPSLGNQEITFNINISDTAKTNETITIKGYITGEYTSSGGETQAYIDNNPTRKPQWIVKKRGLLEIQTMSINPDTISRGRSNITVTYTLKNIGEGRVKFNKSSITEDYPLKTLFTSSGNPLDDQAANWTKTDTVLPDFIDVGATVNIIEKWTASTSSALGLNYLNGRVYASDEFTDLSASDADNSHNDIAFTIVEHAQLVINEINCEVSEVTQGQNDIKIIYIVSNSGGNPLTINTVSTSFKKGVDDVTSDWTRLSTTMPTSLDATSTYVRFEEIYTLNLSATPGTITIDGTITAEETNSGVNASDTDGASTTDTVNVQTPANIEIASISFQPGVTHVSQGQQDIIITYSVNNTGQASANIISVDTVFTKNINNDHTGHWIKGLSNKPVSIPGETNNYTFTEIFQIKETAETGTIKLSGIIKAKDANNNKETNDLDGPPTQASVILVEPSTLELVKVKMVKQQYVLNETGIDVEFTVKNNGGSNIKFNPVGTGSKTIHALFNTISEPSNDVTNFWSITGNTAPAIINAGQTTNFNITYTVNNDCLTGEAYCDGILYGTDEINGNSVSDINGANTKYYFSITSPSDFFIEKVELSDPKVSQGQENVTIFYRIKNTGGTQINITDTLNSIESIFKLSPSNTDVSADWTRTGGTEPTAINGGSSINFSRTFTISNTASIGTIILDLKISGREEGTNNIRKDENGSAQTDSVQLNTPGKLRINSLSTNPLETPYGAKNITLTYNLSNIGGSSVNITKTEPSFTKTSFNDQGLFWHKQSSTLPSYIPANIANVVYTETYNIDMYAGTGEIVIDSKLYGKDANTNKEAGDIDGAGANTAKIQIKTPALIKLKEIKITPTHAKISDTIPVYLILENEGDITSEITQIEISPVKDYLEYTSDLANIYTIPAKGSGSLKYSLKIKKGCPIGKIEIDAKINAITQNHTDLDASDTNGADKKDAIIVYYNPTKLKINAFPLSGFKNTLIITAKSSKPLSDTPIFSIVQNNSSQVKVNPIKAYKSNVYMSSYKIDPYYSGQGTISINAVDDAFYECSGECNFYIIKTDLSSNYKIINKSETFKALIPQNYSSIKNDIIYFIDNEEFFKENLILSLNKTLSVNNNQNELIAISPDYTLFPDNIKFNKPIAIIIKNNTSTQYKHMGIFKKETNKKFNYIETIKEKNEYFSSADSTGTYLIMADTRAPVISEVFPDEDSQILEEDKNIEISANLNDYGSGLDSNSVKLYLNKNIILNFKINNNKLVYIKNSLKKGFNEIKLQANDNTGNIQKYENKFYVTPELAIEKTYNYPNPVTTNQTNIYFELTRDIPADQIKIAIYDTSGEKTAQISANSSFSNKTRNNIIFYKYKTIWDCKNDYGIDVANGVYFYKLVTTSNNKTKSKIGKIAILR